MIRLRSALMIAAFSALLVSYVGCDDDNPEPTVPGNGQDTSINNPPTDSTGGTGTGG